MQAPHSGIACRGLTGPLGISHIPGKRGWAPNILESWRGLMTASRLSRIFERIETVGRMFGSARRAAGAVSVRRRPAAADLMRLGISPDAFREIRQG